MVPHYNRSFFTIVFAVLAEEPRRKAESNEVWGRPVGVLVAADDSLLITDDAANKVWRVSYGG